MNNQNWIPCGTKKFSELKVGDFVVDNEENIIRVVETRIAGYIDKKTYLRHLRNRICSIKCNIQGDVLGERSRCANLVFEDLNKIKLVKPLKEILEKIEKQLQE